MSCYMYYPSLATDTLIVSSLATLSVASYIAQYRGRSGHENILHAELLSRIAI